MKKKNKSKFITLLLVIVAFVIGFFSRDFLFKSNYSTSSQPGKTKNILLPEPKDGKYRVTKVLDGDTVVLETGEKLRYLGIDAPEENQSWGPEAKQFNSELVLSKRVRVEFDREKLDKYGRLLAYVWVDDILVNEELLSRGYAKYQIDKKSARLKYRESLLRAEEWAKDHHDGVWFEK